MVQGLNDFLKTFPHQKPLRQQARRTLHCDDPYRPAVLFSAWMYLALVVCVLN